MASAAPAASWRGDGKGRAKELIFTLLRIDAQVRMGLANKVVPADQLMRLPIDLAGRIYKGSYAVSIAKKHHQRGQLDTRSTMP